MDILKTAIDWTRAEMASSAVFVLFGLVFIASSIGFWQLGKTDVAKAYVVPTLIAGTLLLILGSGLLLQSYGRVTSFAEAFNADVKTNTIFFLSDGLPSKDGKVNDATRPILDKLFELNRFRKIKIHTFGFDPGRRPPGGRRAPI